MQENEPCAKLTLLINVGSCLIDLLTRARIGFLNRLLRIQRSVIPSLSRISMSKIPPGLIHGISNFRAIIIKLYIDLAWCVFVLKHFKIKLIFTFKFSMFHNYFEFLKIFSSQCGQMIRFRLAAENWFVFMIFINWKWILCDMVCKLINSARARKYELVSWQKRYETFSHIVVCGENNFDVVLHENIENWIGIG